MGTDRTVQQTAPVLIFCGANAAHVSDSDVGIIFKQKAAPKPLTPSFLVISSQMVLPTSAWVHPGATFKSIPPIGKQVSAVSSSHVVTRHVSDPKCKSKHLHNQGIIELQREINSSTTERHQ